MLFVKHVLYYWFILSANLTVILVGYAISMFVGHYFIRVMYSRVLKHKKRELSDKLGICERVLYTTAVVLGFQQFILYWLVAKVGAAWVYAQNENHTVRDYNRFMIGNALSIMFGGLGGLVIKYFFIR